MAATESKETPVLRAEPPVLTEASLGVLAREVVKSPFSPIVFLMYLNIPTTTIIHYSTEVSELGLKNADNVILLEFTKKLLIFWKRMRASAKDKDKINDLERALKEMGNTEIADVFRERHQASAEITAEDFS